jgi:hypothetical protein
MQDLTVIGVENGALLAASESGERFRIAIDDVLQSRLRQTSGPRTAGKRVSPREIQGHIRAGLSADEISTLTGASLADIERFEGPVVAERAYVVNSALKVAVQAENANDPLHEEPKTTFGAAIEDRLEKLNATESRWASWKDESGWIVKLSFTSGQIEHDARWQFDPKRHTLSPLNNEAITLSQHGSDLSGGLIPRLRAVSSAPPADPSEDESSDTLTFAPSSARDSIPFTRSTSQESSPAAAAAAISRAEEAPTDGNNQTADLLAALRRRRGERESVLFVDDFASAAEAESEIETDRKPTPIRTSVPSATPAAVSPAAAPPTPGTPTTTGDTGVLRPTRTSPTWATSTPDTPLAGLEKTDSTVPVPETPPAAKVTKRTRSAMPSWDEIVFGARTDDDLG